MVDGKVVYDKQDELYFAHIRPRPETALAPEDMTDAGEEGAVDPEAEEGEAADHDESEDENEGDDD